MSTPKSRLWSDKNYMYNSGRLDFKLIQAFNSMFFSSCSLRQAKDYWGQFNLSIEPPNVHFHLPKSKIYLPKAIGPGFFPDVTCHSQQPKVQSCRFLWPNQQRFHCTPVALQILLFIINKDLLHFLCPLTSSSTSTYIPVGPCLQGENRSINTYRIKRIIQTWHVSIVFT